MVDLLGKIIGIVGRPKTPKAELESALKQLDVAAAERAVDDLEAKRAAMLSSASDAEIVTIDAEIAAANRHVERVIALKAAADKKLAAIASEEAEAERRRSYEEAKRLKADAEKALRTVYPAIAEKFIDLMDTLTRATIAVDGTNRALPAGERPLALPERAVRGFPGEPRQIVREDTVDAWHYAGDSKGWGAVEAEYVSKIVATNGNAGWFEANRGGSAGLRRYDVAKRSMKKIVYLESRMALDPEPLASAVRLPALVAGQPDFWKPAGPNGISGSIGDRQDQILAAVDHARAALDRKPVDPRGQPFEREETSLIEPAEEIA